MTAPLQRLTTTYVETEDRMRLSGEGSDGQIQVLWLTQRLLGRVVSHLCAWLEQHAPQLGSGGAAVLSGGDGDVARDMAQSFAQHAAQAQLASAASEPVAAQWSGWRVDAVDVQTTPEAVHLVLRGQLPEQRAVMTLGSEALRQWLAIVHAGYCRAQWPLAVWPGWMAVEQGLPPRQNAGSLH